MKYLVLLCLMVITACTVNQEPEHAAYNIEDTNYQVPGYGGNDPEEGGGSNQILAYDVCIDFNGGVDIPDDGNGVLDGNPADNEPIEQSISKLHTQLQTVESINPSCNLLVYNTTNKAVHILDERDNLIFRLPANQHAYLNASSTNYELSSLFSFIGFETSADKKVIKIKISYE